MKTDMLNKLREQRSEEAPLLEELTPREGSKHPSTEVDEDIQCDPVPTVDNQEGASTLQSYDASTVQDPEGTQVNDDESYVPTELASTSTSRAMSVDAPMTEAWRQQEEEMAGKASPSLSSLSPTQEEESAEQVQWFRPSTTSCPPCKVSKHGRDLRKHYSQDELDSLAEELNEPQEPKRTTEQVLKDIDDFMNENEDLTEEGQQQVAAVLGISLLPPLPAVPTLAGMVNDWKSYKEHKQQDQGTTSGTSSSALPEVDTSNPIGSVKDRIREIQQLEEHQKDLSKVKNAARNATGRHRLERHGS